MKTFDQFVAQGNLTEMKLVTTRTSPSGKKTAKVYHDREYQEYRVKHFTDGKHHKDADYHTDDKDDAHGTADHWIGESTIDESDDIEHYTSSPSGPMVRHTSKRAAVAHAKKSGDGHQAHSVNKRSGYIYSTWDHTGKKLKYVSHGGGHEHGHWE